MNARKHVARYSYILFIFINLQFVVKCFTEFDFLIKAVPENNQQVADLLQLTRAFKVELWNPPKIKTATLMAVKHNDSKEILAVLECYKIKYNVVSKNIRYLIEDQKRSSSSFRSTNRNFFSTYHSLREIFTKLSQWRRQYPKHMRLFTIGHSNENRQIIAVELSEAATGRRNAKTKPPPVLIECGIHAREWISPASCLFIIEHFLKKPRSLSSYTFHIIPVLNPDGYVYSWTNQRMWRKNRRRNKNSRCYGVDLNRNFGIEFCKVGAERNPCSEVYCGTSAFSEPEAKALRDYASRLQKLAATIHIHSYGQLLIFPNGYTKQKHRNYKKLYDIGKKAAQSIKRHRRQTYKFGQTSRVLYASSGGSDDWCLAALKPKISFTIEGRDKGSYGFLLPRSHIISASNDILVAIVSMLNHL